VRDAAIVRMLWLADWACSVQAGWLIERADSQGTMGPDASIKLDAAGRVHIAYYDATNGDLKYAMLIPVDYIQLTGDLLGAGVHLAWSAIPPAAEYWIYGAWNCPFFSPGLSPLFEHRLAVVSGGPASWGSPYPTGTPGSGWTDAVVAVDGIAQVLRLSNRVGEITFSAQITPLDGRGRPLPRPIQDIGTPLPPPSDPAGAAHDVH